LIGLTAYLWFLFSLADLSGNLFALINGIRAPRITVTRPPAATPRFAKFLEPEVREGLVTVSDESDRSVVVLRGDGLFDKGSVVVKDRYVTVLNRIAEALNQVGGAVLVTGYTDNTPIQTARFPSNWHLSQERADVVRRMLEGRLATPNRVKSEGRADAEPVAPNDTPANQARNRRVVITLLIPPPDRDAQLQSAPRTLPGAPPPLTGAAPSPAPAPAPAAPR
jgi:type VI secretion system protein ImpK